MGEKYISDVFLNLYQELDDMMKLFEVCAHGNVFLRYFGVF